MYCGVRAWNPRLWRNFFVRPSPASDTALELYWSISIEEDNMETSKLITPLFYNGNFNRAGRRMRAILAKEVSDGTQTYRLWRSAGKPDRDYSWAPENDKYLLWVEINGYLAPLGMTDFNLTDICGFEPAAQKLYGGREKRGAWIDALKASGGNDAVSAAVAEEQKEIE